jgi:tRNA pseudouridine38-40 synthase
VAWQYRHSLDAGKMSRAAQAFVGTHDFRSFESRWPQRSSSVRTIYEATVERGRGERNNLITLEFSGNGFLYNMVRAMVGTLVEVGRGVRPEPWPAEVITAGTRRAAGMTAPAHGLFLVRVDYPATEDVAG